MLAQQGRRPSATVNFITAHDGFTLHDLVSFNDKHNEANGEDNRDGINENDSWNCGVEGETEDPRGAEAARPPEAQPAGDPAAVAGRADAAGRRRDGQLATRQQQRLLPGQRACLDQVGGSRPLPDGIRADADAAAPQPPGVPSAPLLPRAQIPGTAVKDIVWLNPEGREQHDDDWHFPEARCLGFYLGGDAGELFYSTGGRQELDDGFVVLMNAFHEPVPFTLPADEPRRRWEVLLDTAREGAAGEQFDADGRYPLEPRSLVVLVRRGPLQSVSQADPRQIRRRRGADPGGGRGGRGAAD